MREKKFEAKLKMYSTFKAISYLFRSQLHQIWKLNIATTKKLAKKKEPVNIIPSTPRKPIN